jgi:hypothetical protein
MVKYDIENYIDDFIKYLKVELNNQITIINNDKGDSLLNTIADSDYYFRLNSTKSKASKQFVYYEPYSDVVTETNEQGGRYVKNYIIPFGIAFLDNSRNTDTDIDSFKRVIRYQKAFEEAFKLVRFKLRGYGTIDINSIKSSNEARDNNLLHISSFNLVFTMAG